MGKEFEEKEYPLNKVKISISRKINTVLVLYKKFFVPFSVLLTDYLAVISNESVREAFNPWAYYYKGIKGNEIEQGVSSLETAFNFGAMKLSNEKPSDVINSIYYKKQNDYAFECGFLFDEFWNGVQTETVLIVNPSPNMILMSEERRSGNSYVVSDETVASLYQIEFPKARFFGLNDEPIDAYERILIVNRNYSIEKTNLLTKWLACCREQAMAVLPNAYVDNIKYQALSLFQQDGIGIEKVLLLDSELTESEPRKKCLLYLKKTSKQSEFWMLGNTKVDNQSFRLLEKEVQVEHDHYWKSEVTLIKLWNGISFEEEKNIVNHKASEFEFSKEIHLFYSIYSERKNRYAGKCSYREIKNVNPLLYGKVVTKNIEKGLRGTSVDEVISNLPKIVFDERVYPFIYTDIMNHFISQNKSVSLKTLWIVMRNQLKETKHYDEEIMSELFIRGGKELADYDVEKNELDDLIHLLKDTMQVNEIPTIYFIQLNALFSVAKKEGIIKYNPLSEIMVAVKKRASERQQEVRNALTKKHFSEEEEKRIFEYLTKRESCSELNKEIPRCVIDSGAMLSTIRLFTGISLREACALQWKDFVKVDGTDEYQLKVSKFVGLKGNMVTHASKEDWLKFRLVPVARPLRILLLQRKEYLLVNGIANKDMDFMPIVALEEDQNAFAKTSKAQEVCRKTLSHARIEKQQLLLPDAKGELLTDIYKYGGDIFVTNLKMRLNHDCGMTLGEINYVLGIKSNDTFSQHYCDYSNSLVQYAMIGKMNRWTAGYESMLSDIQEAIFDTGVIDDYKQKIESGPYGSKCASGEIILKSVEESGCNIKMKISALHEPEITVKMYGGK